VSLGRKAFQPSNGCDVQVIEKYFAGVGVLQGGHGAHQGAFACAIGAQQAEQYCFRWKRKILQGFNTVRISFGKTGDFQRQGHSYLYTDGDAYEKVCYELGANSTGRRKMQQGHGLRGEEAFLSKWISFEYLLMNLRYSGYTPGTLLRPLSRGAF